MYNISNFCHIIQYFEIQIKFFFLFNINSKHLKYISNSWSLVPEMKSNKHT